MLICSFCQFAQSPLNLPLSQSSGNPSRQPGFEFRPALPSASGPTWSRRQHYLGRTYWVVKDPMGLQYFRFQEEEYAILQMLDGTMSMDEIKERFEDEFPPQKITLDELQQFLGMLHRSGLVVADVTGPGPATPHAPRQTQTPGVAASPGKYPLHPLQGFDPERF